MDFVATKEFGTPVVIATGMPHRPTVIKKKKFKKGEIIKGEMIEKNGKPAFVLYKGTCVIPLHCIKQVVVKDINGATTSSAEGTSEPQIKVVSKANTTPKPNNTKKYLDAVIIGAVAGLGATILAEKKGWIALPTTKNKIIGSVIGACAGAYLVYRFSGNKK